jgi:dihydroorotate dehydrogenase electron transfer subunit
MTARVATLSRDHRGTLFVEDAQLLSQQEFPGRQFVIRLHAPKCAAAATPGSFAHLTCDPQLPMRRPLSIMRVDARAGWVEILYKIVGPGLEALSRRAVGASISVLGPIGRGFTVSPQRPRTLLIGGGVGIPPMVFLAESLKSRHDACWQPLVLMGSEIEFPFRARPSTIVVQGIPPEAIACMPLLDDWGVGSRLSTMAGFPGCFEGYVTDLAARRLARKSRCSLAAPRRCSRQLHGSPVASTCRARCRSRSTWPAPSAAARAARSRWSRRADSR